MRPSVRRAVIPVLLVTASAAGAQQPEAAPRTGLDSAILRARNLAEAGNVADGRRILDSLLKVVPTGSSGFAEALYWRAALAPAAVDAERDYRRLLIEAPLAARAEDAMLQLAQLEQARGDRRGAADHFQRFVLSYPDNPARPRVVVSLVRLLFDQGQANRGCEALKLGRQIIPAENLELHNQLEFYAPRCVVFEAAPAASDSSSATRDSLTPAERPVPGGVAPKEPESRPTAVAFYSVQVAAYDSREPATRMARVLKSRGHDARVDGTARPFRVRVGRYGTRADAVKAAATLKGQGINGFVTLVKSER